MKKNATNETELLELVSKIQAQLLAFDKKIDLLIERSINTVKQPSPAPSLNSTRQEARPQEHSNTRTMYDAICADCNKPCSIPFKPSPDRPVYCKDCFSRRKVISLSKISLPDKPREAPAAPSTVIKAVDITKPAAKKKKTAAAKKAVIKKKTAPKKK